MPQRCVLWSLLLEAQGSRWKRKHRLPEAGEQGEGAHLCVWLSGKPSPLVFLVKRIGTRGSCECQGAEGTQFRCVPQSEESHSPGAQGRGGLKPP